MASIRLISTDFDGTVVDHDGGPMVSDLLMERIESLRARGAVWAMNSGRTLGMMREGLQILPVHPDYLLTSEREVFRPAPGGGWEDFGDWNAKCREVHRGLFARTSDALMRIVDYVRERTQARAVYDAERPDGVIAGSEEELDHIVGFIEGVRKDLPMLHYQRNSVYLRFCHLAYHKGAALQELGRLLGIRRGAIFAAGDNHNDLPMLDGRYAGMPACPSNSIEPVRKSVRVAGGYVAAARCGDGVAEALDHFSRLDPRSPAMADQPQVVPSG